MRSKVRFGSCLLTTLLNFWRTGFQVCVFSFESVFPPIPPIPSPFWIRSQFYGLVPFLLPLFLFPSFLLLWNRICFSLKHAWRWSARLCHDRWLKHVCRNIRLFEWSFLVSWACCCSSSLSTVYSQHGWVWRMSWTNTFCGWDGFFSIKI